MMMMITNSSSIQSRLGQIEVAGGHFRSFPHLSKPGRLNADKVGYLFHVRMMNVRLEILTPAASTSVFIHFLYSFVRSEEKAHQIGWPAHLRLEA